MQRGQMGCAPKTRPHTTHVYPPVDSNDLTGCQSCKGTMLIIQGHPNIIRPRVCPQSSLRMAHNAFRRVLSYALGRLDQNLVGSCVAALLQVRLTDMPKDARLLEKALTAALKAAASRLPGIDRMELAVLQRQRSTSFASMMRAIQEQLAVPLVVIFSEMEVSRGLPGLLRLQIHMSYQDANAVVHRHLRDKFACTRGSMAEATVTLQVIYSPAYEHLFAPWMGKLPGHLTPAERLMRTAKAFLKAIQAPLYGDPHLFYATASKCPGVPAWADPMTPSSGCMLYNMNVRTVPAPASGWY